VFNGVLGVAGAPCCDKFVTAFGGVGSDVFRGATATPFLRIASDELGVEGLDGLLVTRWNTWGWCKSAFSPSTTRKLVVSSRNSAPPKINLCVPAGGFPKCSLAIRTFNSPTVKVTGTEVV
jgi:hypothetical protein